MRKIFTTVFILLNINNYSFSQINLTIKISKSFDTSKFKIFYDDGPVTKFYSPTFTNSELILKEPIQSRYARFGIYYPNKFGQLQGIYFFVNKKIATLQINAVADSVINKLSNYQNKNLMLIKNMKVFKPLEKYTKKESKDLNYISDIYNVSPTDSNVKLLNKYSEILALKQLEYIKFHGSEYFYFENFTQDLVQTLKEKYLLELYEVFNSSFPIKFKESYEGKSVRALLEGNLYVKIGMQCPTFKINDYLGNELNSEKLKGKYYLLSFWATWCSPCIEKIPKLKDIRNTYSTEKLEIISLSNDKDSAAFLKGLDKYKMNWLHVFNNAEMNNLFGQKPIPSLYLIDNNGKIKFSSWEKSMMELDSILRNELK